MDKVAFVWNSPIKSSKRVESLQSREASIASDPLGLPGNVHLGRWTASRILLLLGSIALAIIQLYLTGLTLAAAFMNRKPKRGAAIMEQLHVSATLLPILFATIMGRFFHALALYRAQKGISIGTLERFVGCRSIFTAIQRQLVLRPIDLLSLALIAMWCLSPLASQAALRLHRFEPSFISNDVFVRYLPVATAAQKDNFLPHLGVSMDKMVFTQKTHFQTYVTMQSHATLPADWKGFVKIPSFHAVSEGNYSWDPNAWKDVDYSKPIPYSSLIGIPVADLPVRSDSNLTFELESRHWAINCSSIEATKMSLESVQSSGWSYAYLANLGLPDNTTKQEQAWPLKFISLRGRPSETFSNEDLWAFQSGKWPELPVNLAYCSIGPQDVVSKVSCTGQACKVTSMRFLNPIPSATGPGVFSNITLPDESSIQALPDKDVWNPAYWDDDDDDNDIQPVSGDILSSNLGGGGRGMGGIAVLGLRMILDTLPLVSSQTSTDSFTEIIASQNYDSAVPYDLYMSGQGPTYAEAWLAGLIEGYHSHRYMSWMDSSDLPLKDFSARLETLVNTYWQSFYMIPYLERDLLHTSNFDDDDRLGIPFRNIADKSVPFNRVPAIAKTKGPNICVCNARWAFVLLGTALMLFIAAVATVVLDILTIAPDIFGFASSCTRDNFYMARFAEGSYLSGLARARALQNIMVRIGDVRDQHTIGHVALTTNLDDSKKLRRDREYD